MKRLQLEDVTYIREFKVEGPTPGSVNNVRAFEENFLIHEKYIFVVQFWRKIVIRQVWVKKLESTVAPANELYPNFLNINIRCSNNCTSDFGSSRVGDIRYVSLERHDEFRFKD